MRYWQILREQPHPLKFLLSRALIWSRLSRFFMIRMGGFRLRFHPTALSATFWINPKDRHSDEEFFRRYLIPGDTVIDVGANIGHLALTASILVGQKGKVYAIEAHPRIFRYLESNIGLNRVKNLEAINKAIGNAVGHVHFSDIRSDDQNSVILDRVGIDVPVSRLDDLLISATPIALMKVDVEGFEKFVFEGAKTTLMEVKSIYFESWDKNFSKFGYSCGDLFELLHSSGFETFRFISNTKIARLSPDHKSPECENLLALKDIDFFLSRTGLQLEDVASL